MLKFPQKPFSVVIPTLGRPSLNDAVLSAQRENCPVVVVSDGFELRKHDFPCLERVAYHKLARNYGRRNGKIYYGQIPCTLGVLLANTEFSIVIGDDDELAPGSGPFIRNKLHQHPEVDVWIPGLLYNDGHRACTLPGLRPGNVSHPCLRNAVLAAAPMYNIDTTLPNDFHHVQTCSDLGFKVEWLRRDCVLVRPKLPGKHGNGS